ncbi:MAG: hypothetical protein U1E14_08790 [Geminicoccaceae bacterium]
MAEPLQERIARAAEQSVGRAVGFGALGIGCTVLGLSGFPILALRSGAALTALMAAILMLKAHAAPRHPHRRTEVWLILDRPAELRPELAQTLIGDALRAVLERYARLSALAAGGLWLASVVARLAGIPSGF